jgi:hypothetical protein
MRCRRAAMLSLLGWYLLSPLPRSGPKTGGAPGMLVDADRPLRDWRIGKSFSTAGECEAYRKNWIIEQRLKAESLPRPIPAQALLELNTRSNSRCVASDDPQLRPQGKVD